MTQPISYTEFHRRLEAASAAMRGNKVLLDKNTGQPTEREFAKERAVLEAHGIVDFNLDWDMGTRSFRLKPLSFAEKPHVSQKVEIVITNPPPKPSAIRRLLAELAERKGPPDEPA